MLLPCSVAQSCSTLCDPMDCSSPGSSAHGDSPGKNTGVGCHALIHICVCVCIYLCVCVCVIYIYITYIFLYIYRQMGLPWWLRWERISLQCRKPGFHPWVGKIPYMRAWQPTPIFLPGESPWTEEPGRLQSMRLYRVRDD